MNDEVKISVIEAISAILVVVFLVNTYYNHGFEEARVQYGPARYSGPVLSAEVVHNRHELRPALPTTIPATISYAQTKVLSVSAPVFAYAHATVEAEGRLFIGMASRSGNTFPTNELVVFPDTRNIYDYRLITLPHAGDIETMVYNKKSKKVYFALSSKQSLEIYALDPLTLGISPIIATTTVAIGRRPAIVTHDDYVYGITETDPSTVFSINLTNGELKTSSVGHVPIGHSAAISSNGSSTVLYFGGGMSDMFEKTDAGTLEVIGKISIAPCGMSDDMPYHRGEDKTGYIYVGCEVVPNGLRISAEDLKVDRFTLPGASYGMFVYGDNLYNVAQDSNIDAFAGMDITRLKRNAISIPNTASVGSFKDIEPNELLHSSSTDSFYFTAWWGVPGLFRISQI